MSGGERLLGFPHAAKSNWTVANDTVCERIETFLEFQMNQFSQSGPRYLQTYRVPGEVTGNRWEHLFFRSDTYDTAIAAIFFIERDNLRAAVDLVDGICTAMLHDPVGDGRVVAATHGDCLLLTSDGSFATSVFPGGGSADVGNLSWAGIAMTRLYAALKDDSHGRRAKYLNFALTAGNWILTNANPNDDLGGFSGGYEDGGAKRGWRSVEQNTDVFVFFTNLWTLTGDLKWKEGATSAQKFVRACKLDDEWGLRYCAGTLGGSRSLNAYVVPADCLTWTSLASIDADSNHGCLDFLVKNLSAESGGFKGVLFSRTGREVQNENTAAAAMALWSNKRFSEAEVLFASLERQISDAAGTDGFGVVGTPAKECFTGDGLGWSYFNYLHAAASAWTGLGFLFKQGNANANPFVPVSSE